MVANETSNARSFNWLEGLARVLVVPAALTVIAFGAIERVRLAAALPWQTDELPMLLRFTGAGAQVTSEEKADHFQATPYVLRTGAWRALQPPKDPAALHTTTNLWTNLTIYFGGVKPWVARVMPLTFGLGVIFLIGYATRTVGGGITAIAIATGLAALSPVGIIYAAQARGYAEAMFLAPLLLLCVESLREKPRRLARAACVMLIALQLSLTVYTAWVYWVLPVLAASLWCVPRDPVERDTARQMRFALGLILMALLGIMGFYTLDRWPALVFTATNMGEALNSLAAVREFAVLVARTLTPLREFIAVPVLLGWVLLLRSPYRWWAVAMGLGVLAPLAWGLQHGSAGYARNFAYLLGPAAILAGVGIERFFVALLERRNRIVVYAAVNVLLLGGMLAAWDGMLRDARAMILPNWGGAVQAVGSRPPTDGPRWVSPCLAHHWPIQWYQGAQAAAHMAYAPADQPLEILVGTTTQPDQRAEIIYREDPVRQAIVETPAPTWLTGHRHVERLHGVNLRRWRARAVATADEVLDADAGMVWVRWMDDGTNPAWWETVLRKLPSDPQPWFVNFKPVPLDGQLLRTALVEGRRWPEFARALNAAEPRMASTLRLYKLEPLPCYGSAGSAETPPN